MIYFYLVLTTKNTTNMKTTFILLTVFVIAGAVLALTYTFGTTYLRNNAIDGCATASRNTYSEQGDGYLRVIEVPDKNDYQACLELKNVK